MGFKNHHTLSAPHSCIKYSLCHAPAWWISSMHERTRCILSSVAAPPFLIFQLIVFPFLPCFDSNPTECRFLANTHNFILPYASAAAVDTYGCSISKCVAWCNENSERFFPVEFLPDEWLEVAGVCWVACTWTFGSMHLFYSPAILYMNRPGLRVQSQFPDTLLVVWGGWADFCLVPRDSSESGEHGTPFV